MRELVIPDGAKALILAVQKVWFDQMQAGEKLEEYRERTNYWRRRIEGRSYDMVVVTWGYPKWSDVGRHLVYAWKGYQEKKIFHPHFENREVEVFAIDLSQRLQRH